MQMFRHNDDAAISIDLARKIGRNPWSNYVFQTEGIYQNDNDVPVDPVRGVRYKTNRGNGMTYFQAGDPRWRDVNGDYFLDDRDDNMVSGDPEPKMTGGINSSWTYKNFTLNVFASYLLDRTLVNTAMVSRLGKLTQPAALEYSGPGEVPSTSTTSTSWITGKARAMMPNIPTSTTSGETGRSVRSAPTSRSGKKTAPTSRSTRSRWRMLSVISRS